MKKLKNNEKMQNSINYTIIHYEKIQNKINTIFTK